MDDELLAGLLEHGDRDHRDVGLEDEGGDEDVATEYGEPGDCRERTVSAGSCRSTVPTRRVMRRTRLLHDDLETVARTGYHVSPREGLVKVLEQGVDLVGQLSMSHVAGHVGCRDAVRHDSGCARRGRASEGRKEKSIQRQAGSSVCARLPRTRCERGRGEAETGDTAQGPGESERLGQAGEKKSLKGREDKKLAPRDLRESTSREA